MGVVVTGSVLGLVLFLVHGFLRHLLHSWRWRHFPGKHWALSLPAVGHTYTVMFEGGFKGTRAHLKELRKQFGDVFRCDVGPHPTVFLCDYDDILEASRNDAFLAKPFEDYHAFKKARGCDPDGEMAGVFFCKNRTWKDIRKFTINYLGNFGNGTDKDTLEAIISQEVDDILSEIWRDSHYGQELVTIHPRFMSHINNIIYRLLTGERTHHNQGQMVFVNNYIEKMIQATDAGDPVFFLKVTNRLFCEILNIFGLQLFHTKMSDPLKNMFDRIVSKIAPDQGGYFIERFKAQIEDNKYNPSSTFHREKGQVHLLGTIMDLFIAGTDTTAIMMEWILLYLALHPEAQDKIRKQLEDFAGRGSEARLWEDRIGCPLVQSAIEESLRMSPIFDANLPHFVQNDTYLKGRFYPRGTTVVHAHYCVHHDPKHFPNPEKFIFDRFINAETGAFKGPDARVLTLSTGKRRCLGEVIARVELFLFAANLLQAFELSLPEGCQPDIEAVGRMMVPFPVPYQVIVKPTGNWGPAKEK